MTCSVSLHISLAVLHQQAKEVWNNVSQDDVCHLYNHRHVAVEVCVNAQGGYTVY